MSLEWDGLLQLAAKVSAMDLWLAEGRVPVFKGKGAIQAIDGASRIPMDSIFPWLRVKMDSKSKQLWELQGSCRFRIQNAEGIPFRVEMVREAHGVVAVLRAAHANVPSLESLRVPMGVTNLLNVKNGLILFVGPSASGVTTLSSAFTQALCQARSLRCRVLDSDPEWVLPAGKSMLVRGMPQRSLREDVRASLVSETDLFFFGDIQADDLDVVMDACAGGALVIANLRASSSAHALERLSHPLLVRMLRAIVATHLVPALDGKELIQVWDILLASNQVAQALELGELQKLPQIQRSAIAEGMISLDDSLGILVKQGRIHKSEARFRAHEGILFE